MNIRKRLVIWHTGILAGLLLIFITGLFFSMSYHLNREVDQSLSAWADQRFGHLDNKGHLDTQYPALKRLTGMPDSFALVMDETNRLTTESNTRSKRILLGIRPYLKADFFTKRNFSKTIILEGHPYRIQVWNNRDSKGIRESTLIVGRSLIHVDTTVYGLAVFLVVVWLIAVAGCLVVSWFFVGRTLQPVNAMTRDSLRIAKSSELGRRIEDFEGEDEFGELSRALNLMLASLEISSTTQKQFLADASHELRTPLTSIKANLDFLKRAKKISLQEKDSVLIDVTNEVDRMTRLVNELLMLARAEGLISFKHQRIEITAIVREVITGYQLHQTSKDRKIRFEATAEAYLNGEYEKIRQLLVILLDNAIKYSPLGGEVKISILRRGNFVILSITDNGPGIPEPELPLVFKRFYRAGNVGATSGSGLGLAIAKSIVDNHHAHIELNNLVPHGLRVTVKFSAAY